MTLRDRIRFMSDLPARFNTMLEQALVVVRKDQQEELCLVACMVSNAAWQFWIAERPPEDNRLEHEWVVFANVMKIAESENLTLSEKRVAAGFAFLHDTFFIRRIMEQRVREAAEEEKQRLEQEKEKQRRQHMERGAKTAESFLSQLRHPHSPSDFLFTPEEITRCVNIIGGHDLWKLRNPAPPPSRDRLAVACVEADALWPLHPLGVLADLERPDENGTTKDFNNPEVWRKQLEESSKTLVEFRPRWEGVPPEDFIDNESIFRTREGHRLYTEWRRRWNLLDA